MIKKKKGFNPFKMWGAWFGAVITILLPPIIKVGLDITNIYLIHFAFILSIFVSGSLGFLLGWGIHSLFRRFLR